MRRFACRSRAGRGRAGSDRGTVAAGHLPECQFQLQSRLRLLLRRQGKFRRKPDKADDLAGRSGRDRPRAGSAQKRIGPVTVGFLGGEPFANPKLIHQAVTLCITPEGSSAWGATSGFRSPLTARCCSSDDLDLMRSHPVRGHCQRRGRRRGRQRARSGRRESGGAGAWARATDRVAGTSDRSGSRQSWPPVPP